MSGVPPPATACPHTRGPAKASKIRVRLPPPRCDNSRAECAERDSHSTLGPDERLARAMNPPSVPGAPFDQLPADLLVHVAVQLCSGPGLTRMECTCSAWRAAIHSPGPEEMLWKLVTLEKFPRIERVLKAKPTTKTWREIYRSQHRTPVARPKAKAEDFVLSFELKKGEQMLTEGAVPLESPPEDADHLKSAPLLGAGAGAEGAAGRLGRPEHCRRDALGCAASFAEHLGHARPADSATLRRSQMRRWNRRCGRQT